jgi:hypothetical protein
MEKWKFFTLPGLELPPPWSSSRYTDWAIPAPNILKKAYLIQIKLGPCLASTCYCCLNVRWGEYLDLRGNYAPRPVYWVFVRLCYLNLKFMRLPPGPLASLAQFSGDEYWNLWRMSSSCRKIHGYKNMLYCITVQLGVTDYTLSCRDPSDTCVSSPDTWSCCWCSWQATWGQGRKGLYYIVLA